MPQKSISFTVSVLAVALLGLIFAIASVFVLVDDLVESDRVTARTYDDPTPNAPSAPASPSSSGGSSSNPVSPPKRGAGDRSTLQVTIAGQVVAGLPFSATATGTVGPQDDSGGGWIVSSYLLPGPKACPTSNPVGGSNGSTGDYRTMAELPSGNVFVAGPFRMAVRQTAPERPGSYRICGYLTDPGASGAGGYDGKLATQRDVTVASRPADQDQVFFSPSLKSGHYVAEASDILGGRGATSFEMTVEGSEARGSARSEQKIVRVTGKGLPTSACRYTGADPASVPAHTFDTDQVEAGGNDVYTNTFSSNFAGDVRLVGGAASDDEIHATLTYGTAEGCTGSIALIARRK